MTTDKTDDIVNHPSHYTAGSIECIDAMEAAYGPLAILHYSVCCAFKYLWRYLQKHSDPTIDLRKAKWYIDKAIEMCDKLGERDGQ